MKLKLLIISIILLQTLLSYSQEDEFYFDDETSNPPKTEKVFNNKVFYGAHYVVAIGPYTNINLSPEISYQAHKMLQIGAGINYSYYYVFGQKSSAVVYGGRAFARFFPVERIYLQGEAELLNILEKTQFSGFQQTSTFITGTLIGIGYQQKLSPNFSFMSTFLYNVTVNSKTPYNNPIYRVGFIFHL